MISTRPNKEKSPITRVATINPSNTNAMVGLKVAFNQRSIEFAMPLRLHILYCAPTGLVNFFSPLLPTFHPYGVRKRSYLAPRNHFLPLASCLLPLASCLLPLASCLLLRDATAGTSCLLPPPPRRYGGHVLPIAHCLLPIAHSPFTTHHSPINIWNDQIQ